MMDLEHCSSTFMKCRTALGKVQCQAKLYQPYLDSNLRKSAYPASGSSCSSLHDLSHLGVVLCCLIQSCYMLLLLYGNSGSGTCSSFLSEPLW